MEEYVGSCPRCGTECREGALYCDACGERLQPTPPKQEENVAEFQEDEKAVKEQQDELEETDGELQAAADEEQESEDDINEAEDSAPDSSGETTDEPTDTNDIIIGIDEKLDRLLELFEDRISRTDYETLTMKKLSDEVQGYRDDLYRKLTLPLIKDMINVREALTSTQASYASENGEDVSVPLSVVGMFSTMIKEMLKKYGVEAVMPETGNEFVALHHKAIDKVSTDDEQLHGHIASVSSDCYMQAGECIAPAMVSIFVYEQGKDVDEEVGRAVEQGVERETE